MPELNSSRLHPPRSRPRAQILYPKCILDGEMIIYNRRKERFEEFGALCLWLRN